MPREIMPGDCVRFPTNKADLGLVRSIDGEIVEIVTAEGYRTFRLLANIWLAESLSPHNLHDKDEKCLKSN